MKDEQKVLSRKITPKEIQWRIQSSKNGKTSVVPYLTNRCVMERFDEAFGIDGWQNTFEPWRTKGVKCGMSVLSNDNKWITKYDGADETNIEPTKGGFSDSMKRAAVQWGLGRDLYDYPMIQLEGETKFISRQQEKQLSQLAFNIASGTEARDYVLIGANAPTPQAKAQPKAVAKEKVELKPESKETWKKAIGFLKGSGLIGEVEASYALTDVNRQLLMDAAASK